MSSPVSVLRAGPRPATAARALARALAVAVLLVLLACSDARAATGTVVPNGTVTTHPSWLEIGCPMNPHQCLDEALPGTFNDSDYVTNNVAGPAMIQYDLGTLAGADVVTDLDLRLRAACTSGASSSLDVGAYLSSGTQVGTTQTLNFIGATQTTASAAITGLVLTQANLDGLRLRITGGGCSVGSTQIAAATVGVTYWATQSTTIVPDSERAIAGGVSATGCSAPNRHLCIDDLVDADYLQLPSSSSDFDFELTSVPAARLVTGVSVTVRHQCDQDGLDSARVALFDSLGAPIIAPSATSVASSDATWYTWTSSVTATNLSRTDLDGMWLRISSRDCDPGDGARVSVSQVRVNVTYVSLPTVTGTIIPDGEHSAPVNMNSYVGCVAGASWQCIDEDAIGAPINADRIHGNNGGTAEYDFTPLNTEGVSSFRISVNAGCVAGAGSPTVTVRPYFGDGSPMAAAQVLAVTYGTPSPTYSTVSTTPIPGPFTKAEIDDMYVAVTYGNCISSPIRIASLSVEATHVPGPTVTGTARDAAGAVWGPCDGTTANVGVIVQGGAPSYVPCDDATGAYAVSSATWVMGNVVTTFLVGGTDDGATYRTPLADSSVPIPMDIDAGRVRFEAGSTMHTLSIAVNDSTDHADIPVVVTGGNVEFLGLAEVRPSAIFVQATDVTAPRVRIGTGGAHGRWAQAR